MRHDRSASQVTIVTSAGRSHSEDIGVRQRRYVLTQSVRILCVVLATALPVSVTWKIVLIFGAVALDADAALAALEAVVADVSEPEA